VWSHRYKKKNGEVGMGRGGYRNQVVGSGMEKKKEGGGRTRGEGRVRK